MPLAQQRAMMAAVAAFTSGLGLFGLDPLRFGCLSKSLDTVGFKAVELLAVRNWQPWRRASSVDDCSGATASNPEPES